MANENGMMSATEANILKVAIANLMDVYVGSTKGWTNEREVKMLMKTLDCSEILAKTILESCDEVREHCAYSLI